MPDQPPGRDTILLVEDEPFVAMMAQEVLEDHGFRVVVAARGRTAIALVRAANENDPDSPVLAMVDIGLPDIRGEEVVRALLRLRPTLPVIIVTGYTTDEIEAEFASAANIAVLRKPYDVCTLGRTLQRLGLNLPQG